MTGGSAVSAESESSSHDGSGHGRMFKVMPIDSGAAASGDGPVKPNSPPKAETTTSGSAGRESLKGRDESSDQDLENRGPSIPSERNARPAPADADPDRSTCPQERPSTDRRDSLPPARAERTPWVAAAKSNASRFSTGMIDERTLPLEKCVSFGRLCVRKYPIILGDHPDCSCGPPVTIDWTYREFRPVNVDDYETRRPSRRKEREMVMPYVRRREILTRMSGHTEVELLEATREAQRVRKQRKRTVQTLRFQGVEEAVQTTMRGLRKLRPGSGGGSRGSPSVNGAEATIREESGHRKSARKAEMDGGAVAVPASGVLAHRHRSSLHLARPQKQPQQG